MDDESFTKVVEKDQRTVNILNDFRSKGWSHNIYLSESLLELRPCSNELNYFGLPKGFFSAKPSDVINILGNQAHRSIFITLNSDVQSEDALSVISFLSQNTDNLLISWDLDNHHWITLSKRLAKVHDIYFAASNENLYEISQFNIGFIRHAYCGVIQWGRAIIKDNLDFLYTKKRYDDILGEHRAYQHFEDRNRIINLFNRKYKNVHFSSGYESLDMEYRLRRWSDFKLHLIAPVLNGVPIRLFDALITGGLPIVPSMLYSDMKRLGLESHVFFYNPSALGNVDSIVQEALACFNRCGITGIVERINLGLQHHGDIRLNRMLEEILASEPRL